MQKFDGFKAGKYRHIKVPVPFFSDLLPLIDDLAELKVTLFCLWAMAQKDGAYRYLRDRDFLNRPELFESLRAAVPDMDPAETLGAALRRAVERGTLLRVEVVLDRSAEPLYFMNSASGRSAAESVEAGRWQPGDAHNPVEILPERPNVYQLYEANIGSITPMIADELKDAEAEFPGFWLEEAVRLAVEHNKRSWRYIRAILDRWEREGRDRGLTGRPAQQDGQKYISGKYATFIKNAADD
ncbi:MAG: DnaD domain protein [Anaerolineae bacterium]|nr:DnaD domain protein [Anaerolineae bacterium]